MIRATLRAAAAAALLTAAAAGTAEAQLPSPIKFNVRAGVSNPTGDLRDGVNTGFTVGGGLTLRAPLFPVAARVDGDYNRMAPEVGDGNLSIWSVTANAQLSPGLIPVYIVGGAGYYGLDNGESNATKLGVNGGAGIRLPLLVMSAFVEARYHHVFADAETFGGSWNYLPIVVGIEF